MSAGVSARFVGALADVLPGLWAGCLVGLCAVSQHSRLRSEGSLVILLSGDAIRTTRQTQQLATRRLDTARPCTGCHIPSVRLLCMETTESEFHRWSKFDPFFGGVGRQVVTYSGWRLVSLDHRFT